MNKSLGYFVGLISGLFWAIGMTFSAYAFKNTSISPITIAIFNDLFGFLILTSYILIRNRRIPVHIFKNVKNYAVVIGAILAGPIGMICNNYAISTIGSPITAAITATFPAFSVIFSIILLKQRFTFRIYLAITIIVVSLIIQNYDPSNINITILGILSALMCSLAWGSESVLTSFAMMDDLSSIEAIFLRQCTSILSYSVIVLPFSFEKVVSDISYNIIPILFVIALFNLLSYITYYKTISEIDVPTATGLNSSYVIFAPLLSLIFLGESMSLKVIGMSFFVLLGLILIFSNKSTSNETNSVGG